MSLRCRLSGHVPAPGPVWNAGRHFTTCVRCGVDLVRGRGTVWHPVPPGMRVVWKPASENEGAVSPEADEGGLMPRENVHQDSDVETDRALNPVG